MRNWQVASQKTETIGVLLFPRFSNHCLANAVEPMRAANELAMRAAYRWDFATIDGQAVHSSSGLPVLPARRLSDHPGGDYLLVMASHDAETHASPSTLRALRSAAGRFRHVVGLDTGSWILARAGLLDGHRATIYWSLLADLAERFDAVDVEEARFVIDGNRLTCGGAMTAFELVLELIRRRHGEALRIEVASYFMFEASERPLGSLFGRNRSPLVDRGLSLMSANLETPLNVPELARLLGTTPRSLSRAFRAGLGAPPITVYKRLRLMAARRHAEQSALSVAEIALRCGYENASAMTRAFVAEFGVPPSTLRRQ